MFSDCGLYYKTICPIPYPNFGRSSKSTESSMGRKSYLWWQFAGCGTPHLAGGEKTALVLFGLRYTARVDSHGAEAKP
jgi:hypothetical protein